MGAAKPVIVQRLLSRRAPAAAVVLSDVDTVWLRDPADFLARHPAADVAISTDCLSHWAEASAADARGGGAAAPVRYHRCGHLPGATFGRAFNTGVVIFRNRYGLMKSQHRGRLSSFGPMRCSNTLEVQRIMSMGRDCYLDYGSRILWSGRTHCRLHHPHCCRPCNVCTTWMLR